MKSLPFFLVTFEHPSFDAGPESHVRVSPIEGTRYAHDAVRPVT
jgi:hypothetical protein